MKEQYLGDNLYMWHQPINTKTLKRWRKDWKLEQFRNKPHYFKIPSMWLATGVGFVTVAFV